MKFIKLSIYSIIFSLLLLSLCGCNLRKDNDLHQNSNISNISETQFPRPNDFSFKSIEELKTWTESRGDLSYENLTYLKFIKEKGEILLPVIKNCEYEMIDVDLFYPSDYNNILYFTFSNKNNNKTASFLVHIGYIEESNLCSNISEYYETLTQKGKSGYIKTERIIDSKTIQYIYRDCKPYKDESGSIQDNWSKAIIIVDGKWRVIFEQGGDLCGEPFNHEILDYFDFETVKFDLTGSDKSTLESN
ncbi:MAG: hypothetical protein A2Y17_00600 [Clostridiales bacterium GWF2_38_85]|nr:MAG: hypothetical protein A2Y17_00600 [Clostridiales bacterium GWF2_38_85]HBL84601.1 hypothetical protein [Clostridiales bacterium]